MTRSLHLEPGGHFCIAVYQQLAKKGAKWPDLYISSPKSNGKLAFEEGFGAGKGQSQAIS